MASLFEPFTFRTGLQAKNRIALAPMTNLQSHADGTISDNEMHWLLSRADGGFGLIATCAVHVAKDGQGWPGELGTFADEHIPGLARLASGLHQRGALAFAQIFHGGMRADQDVSGTQAISADTSDLARAATEDDLARITQQFAEAAARAERAGFDGVEIHGAHGYLLTQFLSSVQNTRTDRFGGNLEGRARLSREVVRAVRANVSPKFTVGIRLSPENFGNAQGMDLDESIQTAQWLAEDGIDFLHISIWHSDKNTAKRPESHAVNLFREALPADVRILVAGAIWTRREAEALLARGADAVALGRAAIVNPDWPRQVVDPAWQPKRPPLTIDELRARALSPVFAEYMRNWKDFVAE